MASLQSAAEKLRGTPQVRTCGPTSNRSAGLRDLDRASIYPSDDDGREPAIPVAAPSIVSRQPSRGYPLSDLRRILRACAGPPRETLHGCPRTPKTLSGPEMTQRRRQCCATGYELILMW